MHITRAQVDQVKDLLGLDRHLTHSISISPQSVHVQSVALVNGHPDIRDGMTLMESAMYDIEEVTDGDA